MVYLITFGKINKFVAIPFINGLMIFIYRKISKYSVFQKHILIDCLYCSGGMSLSLIPYFIFRYRMWKAMENKKIQKLQGQKTLKKQVYHLEYNDRKEEINYDRLKYILILAFLDFFQTILVTTYDYFSKVEGALLSLRTLDIVFISILSFYFLKYKLYKHQVYSVIENIFMGILLGIINEEFSKIYSEILISLIRIVDGLAYTMVLILIRYLIESKYLSPYKICALIGGFTFFFYLLALIISTFIKCKNNSFCPIQDKFTQEYYFDSFKIYFFEHFNKDEFICSSCYIIITGIYNILLMLTLKYLHPCHILISLMTLNFINFIEKIFLKGADSLLKEILIFIINFFIFLGVLVYSEILELNFCGLQKNTKKNIIIRGEQDIRVQDSPEKSIENELSSTNIDNSNYGNETKEERLFNDDSF